MEVSNVPITKTTAQITNTAKIEKVMYYHSLRDKEESIKKDLYYPFPLNRCSNCNASINDGARASSNGGTSTSSNILTKSDISDGEDDVFLEETQDSTKNEMDEVDHIHPNIEFHGAMIKSTDLSQATSSQVSKRTRFMKNAEGGGYDINMKNAVDDYENCTKTIREFHIGDEKYVAMSMPVPSPFTEHAAVNTDSNEATMAEQNPLKTVTSPNVIVTSQFPNKIHETEISSNVLNQHRQYGMVNGLIDDPAATGNAKAFVKKEQQNYKTEFNHTQRNQQPEVKTHETKLGSNILNQHLQNGIMSGLIMDSADLENAFVGNQQQHYTTPLNNVPEVYRNINQCFSSDNNCVIQQATMEKVYYYPPRNNSNNEPTGIFKVDITATAIMTQPSVSEDNNSYQSQYEGTSYSGYPPSFEDNENVPVFYSPEEVEDSCETCIFSCMYHCNCSIM